MGNGILQYYYSYFPDRQFLKEMERFRSLTVEVTNICNANCIFCGYQYMARKKSTMDDDVFKKAIDDFVTIGGGRLNYSVVVGDPLLDEKFVERIRYARSFSQIKAISTVTNCLNLHKVGAQNLLSSGLSGISVSMTGFDAEMYRRIYRSGRYEQMKQNALELLRTNSLMGRPVKIMIGLRIDRPLKDVLRYQGFNEVTELADSIEANYYYDSWSGRIRPEALSGTMQIRPAIFHFMKRNNPCSMLYGGIGVLVDGTVTLCPCRDLNGDSDLVVGSVNASSLTDICYSEKIGKIRDDWLHGEYIPDICRDCTHYNPYTYMMLKEVRKQLL